MSVSGGEPIINTAPAPAVALRSERRNKDADQVNIISFCIYQFDKIIKI